MALVREVFQFVLHTADEPLCLTSWNVDGTAGGRTGGLPVCGGLRVLTVVSLANPNDDYCT